MNKGEQNPCQVGTLPISVFQVTQTKLQYLYNFLAQVKCYHCFALEAQAQGKWTSAFLYAFFQNTIDVSIGILPLF